MVNAAICCMAKLENRYLREWVEYHLALGFKHIYIYDNNDAKGERCGDCIREHVDSGKVSVIDYRGKKQTSCQIQVLAYQSCYDTYGREHEWMMFIDVDEFLVLKRHRTIGEYLSEKAFAGVPSIRINWICYGDSGHLRYEDGLVRERFTKRSKSDKYDNYYKTIVRCGIDGLRIPNVHYTSNTKTVATNDGKTVPYTMGPTMKEYNHDWAYVAHYVTKSLEEYIEIKRRRRGDGASKTRLTADFYWRYNEKTPEAEKLMRELFR